MHTTHAIGRFSLRGRLRSWHIATLCALLAVIAIAAVGSSPALAASKQYEICTRTTDITNAGTDSTVEVRLYGTSGTSPKVNMDAPGRDDFERGKKDCFGFWLGDVGTIKQLALDVSCDMCWSLDWITVNGIFFPFYNWVPDSMQYLAPA
jgi:hypothetical protein